MSQYRIQVHCNSCGGFHLLPLTVTLQDGPPERKNLEEAYSGKPVPDLLAAVLKTALKCPATGKPFTPDRTADIFLIPVEQ
jgi:hypothetical protein